MRAWIRMPSPAMAVAIVALVVALGGTTVAAVRIGTKQIKNNAITSEKIRNGAVKRIDLARNSVVTAKIVAGAVNGLQIHDGSIGNADLGNNSISGGKLRGGAVGNSDLANDAVTTAKLRAAAVGNSDLADSSVNGAKVADSSLTAADIKDGEVVEGNGRMFSTAVLLPSGASATTLLTIPNLGTLRASCSGGITTTQWSNTASGPVFVTNQVAFHRTGTDPITSADINYVNDATLAAETAADQPANAGVNGQESVMWQASVDDTGGDRVATVWATTAASGTSCRIAAQGLSTATP